MIAIASSAVLEWAVGAAVEVGMSVGIAVEVVVIASSIFRINNFLLLHSMSPGNETRKKA